MRASGRDATLPTMRQPRPAGHRERPRQTRICDLRRAMQRPSLTFDGEASAMTGIERYQGPSP